MNARIRWDQLPSEVRAGVEDILGEVVASAQSQAGGFSPGSADRVVLSSGRRAFVKAVSAGVNTSSVELHRREAAVAAALPAGVSAPEFLGKYDDGTWVALVLADVDGRHPQEPWVDAELTQVLDALVDVGQVLLPADLDVPPYEESLTGAFLGWEKLAARPLADMPAWAGEHLGELATLARAGVAALAGDALVHGDLRTDNILLTADGTVFLDWPWAARGAPWVDALSVLLNVKTLDPAANVDQWLAGHPVFAGAAPEAVSAVLAGWAGYFLDMSRRPAPPGIPTLRAFQRKQADVLISWLQERLAN
ncbi:phosphotransferase [Specibacter sp. AOP5-B1-6]|uniref:phosphotransferase n=1 Tax=Specibacter sp. AOP5-B1-6 TaxID=3457653 RepID=UPI00402B633C